MSEELTQEERFEMMERISALQDEMRAIKLEGGDAEPIWERIKHLRTKYRIYEQAPQLDDDD